MECTLYAEGVVKAALETRSTRYLWRGHHAWNVRLLLTSMPRRFRDYYFSRAFNLIELTRLSRERICEIA